VHQKRDRLFYLQTYQSVTGVLGMGGTGMIVHLLLNVVAAWVGCL
ncbi:MAG: hypothetical protein HOH77_16895, partial [Candidatus Latescibacteria bacterium]|nr:hypothetical protein [Candidatus Latescibacterota bacterium]